MQRLFVLLCLLSNRVVSICIPTVQSQKLLSQINPTTQGNLTNCECSAKCLMEKSVCDYIQFNDGICSFNKLQFSSNTITQFKISSSSLRGLYVSSEGLLSPSHPNSQEECLNECVDNSKCDLFSFTSTDSELGVCNLYGGVKKSNNSWFGIPGIPARIEEGNPTLPTSSNDITENSDIIYIVASLSVGFILIIVTVLILFFFYQKREKKTRSVLLEYIEKVESERGSLRTHSRIYSDYSAADHNLHAMGSNHRVFGRFNRESQIQSIGDNRRSAIDCSWPMVDDNSSGSSFTSATSIFL